MFGNNVHGHAWFWHHHHIGGGPLNLFPALTSWTTRAQNDFDKPATETGSGFFIGDDLRSQISDLRLSEAGGL